MQIINLLKHKKNLLFLYLSQIFSAILPLITIPVLTRGMGVNMYGEYILVQSVTLFGLMIVDYGYNLSGTAFVAINRDNPESISKKNSTLILNRIFLSLFSTFFSFLMMLILKIENPEQIILPLFLIYLGNALFPLWWFQGTEKMLSIAIFYVVTRAYILIPILIENITISAILNWQAVAYIMYSVFIIWIYKINIIPSANYKFLLSDGKNQFISSALLFMYTSSIILIGGLMFSDKDMGGYGVADKLIKFIVYTFSPISQVFYPKSAVLLSVNPKKGMRKILKNCIFVASLYVFILLFFNFYIENIMRFVSGTDFVQFSYIFHILSAWAFFFILNNFLGVQILQNINMDYMYTRSVFAMTCVVVIINIMIFLLKLPIAYLGISLVIAEFFGFLILSFLVFTVYRKKWVLSLSS